MSYQCEIIETVARPTIAVRRRTTFARLPQVIDEGYAALDRYLAAQGAQPAGPPYVAYLSMDAEGMDVELGLPVAQPLPASGDIHPSTLPGGRVASCLHTGPYDQLAQAHMALSQWLRDRHVEGTGTAYDIYVDNPAQTPPPALKTQILMPLRPA